MYRIKTTCHWCGPVTLGPKGITVRVCAADASTTYVFTCPCCDRGVAQPADRHALHRLFAIGVEFQMWDLPAELKERRSGPPIDDADVMAMRALLRRPDWFAELLARDKGTG